MATLGDNQASWKYYASQLDPDGKAARIIDVLTKQNDIIDDMYVIPGNKEYGLQTTKLAGTPTVAIRGVNQTIQASVGAFDQLKVEAALFTALGLVDKELVDAAEDPAGFRVNHNKTYIGAMGDKVGTELFYGSIADNAQSFNGLSHFYNATATADYGNYVVKAGGIDTDNRSLWLIDWGEDSVCGFYPKNTQVGLQHTDFGVDLIKMADGGHWPAYRDLWEWRTGIAVRDHRKIVRVCNIDKSALATIGSGSDTSADLLNLMIEAIGLIPKISPNARFYCGRSIKTALAKKAIGKTNAFLTMEEMANKQITPSFLGVPIRLCEALDTDEALIS